MEDLNNANPIFLPLIENTDKEKELENNADNDKAKKQENENEKEKDKVMTPQPEKIAKTNIDIQKFLNKKTERDNEKKIEEQPPIKKPADDLPKLTLKNPEERKQPIEANEEINKEVPTEPLNKLNALQDTITKEPEINKPTLPFNSNTQIIDNLSNGNKNNEIINPSHAINPNPSVLKPIQNNNLSTLMMSQTQPIQPPLLQPQTVTDPIQSNQNPIPDPPVQLKKMITFADAKKEIEDFTLVLEKLEKEIYEKYSITFPEFNYEEMLPEDIQMQLIGDYFESTEMKELLNKATNESLPQ